MTIRVMTLADYPAVYALWLATPGMGLNDVDESEEGIRRYLSRNPATCFVALEGRELIGVILSGHDGRRGMIYHMAVARQHQRQGIGSRLLERALEALKKEGIHKVTLVAFERNQAGNAFWESQGFEKREDLVYRNKALTHLNRTDT